MFIRMNMVYHGVLCRLVVSGNSKRQCGKIAAGKMHALDLSMDVVDAVVVASSIRTIRVVYAYHIMPDVSCV